MWDVQVQCAIEEMAIFNPPAGSTCGDYLQTYLSMGPQGYLDNPVRLASGSSPRRLTLPLTPPPPTCALQNATANCMYCPVASGAEYLAQRNLYRHVYGWRNICITALFCLSSYACVFVLMKLRSKKTKVASVSHVLDRDLSAACS